MTPERWKQVDQLLQEALSRDSAERAAFIAEACGADDELRVEVESLLGFHDRAENFIETPPSDMAADWLAAKESRAGQTIVHYQLVRRIGRGGMGEVYLARDTRLERPAAIKLLQTSLTQDAARVRRFRQEARAASALNHPNILTIYEVGQDDLPAGGAHFIAAEYVDGQTLRAFCQGAGLALGAALDILIQVAGALTAAHEAGIVHRDIKPENIMLRRDGLVKVLDFGLAKLTEQAMRPHIRGSGGFARLTTQPGAVMGTINYMSPEQARGMEVDERSDLFSLGIVMYELLTGRAPFDGETTGDVMVALLVGEPRPLARYVAKLPEALQRIINRALAKPVEERYQTARELSAELKRLKEELEFAARLKGQAGSKDDILTLTVGVAAGAAEHSTFETLQAVDPLNHARRPGGARFAALRGWSRRYSKALAMASLALILGAAGLAWRRFASHDNVIDSLAVLPFANDGADPQMAYVPDSLTESLIDRLSQLPALRVSAHSTISGYKGRAIDPRQAGKELQVRAVVAGRVLWQGDRMVIRVELVEASNGSRMWGDEFRRAHSDIVTAQDEIAREIAAKLHRRLSPASQQQLARRHSNDSRAYELYAQGRALYLQYNRISQGKALDFFNRAIALDPRYALAFCGIADVYADFSSQYMPPSEAMPKARDAALKAIELDETLPEAHHSLALVKWWGDWDWEGADREFKRTLELNPNLVPTRIYYAEFLMQQKRFEEALRVIEQAKLYDPASLQAMYREGDVYALMRQYDRAIEIYRKVLGLSPDLARVQRTLSGALSQQGRHQEAIEQIGQLHTPVFSAARAYIYARAGRRGDALKLLQELNASAASESVSPISIASIYVALGDREQAFALLRKAYNERSDHLLHVGASPTFDPLRSDPRFDELMRGMGLAP
ncbi:MAG TPA: protein kinase [Blastocatellia bacterium]|nr:protein kinase [Blastocatellia bacterium]